MSHLQHIKHLQDSEEVLIKGLAIDSHDAFDQLYKLHWLLVYNEAYRRLRNQDEAENITQDVFMTIWENRKSSTIRNFKAYLYVLTKNKTLNFIVKNKPALIADYEDQLLDQLSPLHELLIKEAKSRVSSKILSLPPQQKIIFALHYEDNKSTDEIAELMGISVKTVRNHLSRAATTIRSVLKILFLFF